MRPSFLPIVLCAIAWLASAGQACAKSVTALAMHGQPKYAENFTSFDYVNPDAPKGGELKLSVTGSFDSLNHHIVMGTVAEGMELTTDRLMARSWNEPFTLYGLVAQSMDVAPDRSSIVFHLRKEARFHDGQPMTADDVIFSFEMYKKYGHPVRRRVYALASKVTKLDAHTVRFDFGPGYDAESVMILGLMPVVPKHWWEAQGHDFGKTLLTPPLGSGPYKIAKVEPGRQIVYERVKDYWAKDLPVNRGHYNFDKISYQYFRDDDIARQSFKAGNYDVRREFDGPRWKTDYDFPAVKSGKIVLEELEHHRPERVRSLIFNTRRDLFGDRRVRQALGLAFDFEWMNKNLFHGAFRRINSFFPNSELAATGTPEGAELEILSQYKGALPAEVFGPAWQPPVTSGSGPSGMRENLKTAAELLRQSGWIVKDNVLTHEKTGQKFTFEILLNDPNDEKVALAFARNLKRLGIEVRVRSVDSAQFTGRLDKFDYDMVLHQWINSLSPGNEQVNYWGSVAADKNGTRNYAGIRDTVVDALCDSIARAPDREGLVARARALDRVLMWGSYTIPLYYLGRDLVAHVPDIRHPEKMPVYGMVLETWWRDIAKPQQESVKP